MKITAILFVFAFTQINAVNSFGQNTKVSLKMNHVSIQNILDEIEQKTDYKFLYEKNVFQNKKAVSVNVKNKKLSDVLDTLFEDQNVTIVYLEKQIVIKPKLKTSDLSLPKITNPKTEIVQQSITGLVTDENGVPLPGASILEKGTTNGTQSDFDGNYTLTVNSNAILVISYIGYKTQEIPVGTQTTINIQLKSDAAALDEIVVVGYGTQKKTNVTGSIATVKMDNVINVPASNVKSLLIGQIPGLITNQNPGLPGQDNVQLNIRGFAAPLVIVDGIESSLDRLDANDVESITVLKDASAAIYGTRGGNGVILVTTKRGKTGKTEFNYHGWYGTQNEVSLPEFANAADYLEIQNSAAFNTQYDPAAPNDPINYPATQEEINQYRSGELPSYNWKDRLVKNSGAQIVNHNFSVSGGSEKITHYTSIGVLKQNSVLRGDYDYSKITFTHNMDADVTKDLHMALNASYIDEVTDYAFGTPNEILNDLRTTQPFYNYELPDPDRVPFSGFSQRSIIGRMFKKFAGYNLKKTQTLAAALDVNYDASFLPGLTLGAKVNIRFSDRYTEILNKPYKVYSFDPNLVTDTFDGYTSEGDQSGNEFTKSYTAGPNSPRRRIVSRFYGEFNKAYGKHELGLLAFFEHENNQYNSLSATRLDNLSVDVPQIGGDNELTETGGIPRQIEYTRISYASRLNYNYDNKYLLEATLRADASSKFGPKNRWGYFPSVSAGWNVHKEKFLENNNTLNQLKLRLSYSQSGIDSNVGNTAFEYLTGFEEQTNGFWTSYTLDGVSVPIISNAGLVNELISWEEVTMYNAGLDFSLLKNKVYGEVDVFYRERKGLLGPDLGSTSLIFGASLPLININTRNNRGWELALGYRDNIGDFKFDVKGNVAFSREKYDHQEQDIDFDNPRDVKYRKLSGNWTNRYFGYKTDGLFNSQAEVDEYINTYTFEDIEGTPKPGDIRYVDVNGDNIINLDDREVIGRSAVANQPPNLTYALQTIFSYKNWKLVTQWQGASLFNINVGGHVRAPFFNTQVPLTFHTKYAWIQDPANPGVNINPNAQLPAFESAGVRSWNNQASDFWLKDGTYVRLKSATLAYNLPKEVLNKIGLSNLELYVSGDNLLTLSKLGIYKEDHDPEQLSGATGFGLPLKRTYTLGVKLGL